MIHASNHASLMGLSEERADTVHVIIGGRHYIFIYGGNEPPNLVDPSHIHRDLQSFCSLSILKHTRCERGDFGTEGYSVTSIIRIHSTLGKHLDW